LGALVIGYCAAGLFCGDFFVDDENRRVETGDWRFVSSPQALVSILKSLYGKFC